MSTFTAIVGGTAVRMLTGRHFVTKEECRRNHHHENQENAHLVEKFEELQKSVSDYQVDNKKRYNTLFRMVRGLIVHSALDKETQERILNENGYK